jgi:hypothetical protein
MGPLVTPDMDNEAITPVAYAATPIISERNGTHNPASGEEEVNHSTAGKGHWSLIDNVHNRYNGRYELGFFHLHVPQSW